MTRATLQGACRDVTTSQCMMGSGKTHHAAKWSQTAPLHESLLQLQVADSDSESAHAQ